MANFFNDYKELIKKINDPQKIEVIEKNYFKIASYVSDSFLFAVKMQRNRKKNISTAEAVQNELHLKEWLFDSFDCALAASEAIDRIRAEYNLLPVFRKTKSELKADFVDLVNDFAVNGIVFMEEH